MKKLIALGALSFFIVGCSSNQPKQELFIDAAAACAQVCKAHPEIKEISSSAGAGLPLLFVGGMETSCECER